jgi:hypothetical protein
MRVDVHRELEELVGEIRTLVHRLREHDQPLATQLLEMAVLEIRSRMYGIDDDEVQALVDILSDQKLPETIRPARLNDQADNPAGIMSSPRVVIALGEISRNKHKRRN